MCNSGNRQRVKFQDEFSKPSQLEDSATFLVLEWVEKLFNEKLETMKDLALFLIEKMYVDNRSGAANALLASVQKSAAGGGGGAGNNGAEPGGEAKKYFALVKKQDCDDEVSSRLLFLLGKQFY